jgi:hypothetical protein
MAVGVKSGCRVPAGLPVSEEASEAVSWLLDGDNHAFLLPPTGGYPSTAGTVAAAGAMGAAMGAMYGHGHHGIMHKGMKVGGWHCTSRYPAMH